MESRSESNTKMNHQSSLDRIFEELEPHLGEGEVARYIPELANVDPHQFGIALRTAEGELHRAGAAGTRFSIQSISKVFSLALAMRLAGDALWERCGREPSGNAFNSLVQLELEEGIPRNPFINAGALVMTDMIISHLGDAKSAVLDFVRELAGADDIRFNDDVARSEAQTGHRNAAMAHFMKSFGNLRNPPGDVLDAYFHHCSIEMSCEEIATACLFLANGGRRSRVGDEVVSASQAKYINAIMLTCGTYDAAGEFAYRVGLPAKSGVGGGIVATLPGAYSVCAFSPGLDRNGNSRNAARALELLTTYSGRSIF